MFPGDRVTTAGIKDQGAMGKGLSSCCSEEGILVAPGRGGMLLPPTFLPSLLAFPTTKDVTDHSSTKTLSSCSLLSTCLSLILIMFGCIPNVVGVASASTERQLPLSDSGLMGRGLLSDSVAGREEDNISPKENGRKSGEYLLS